MPFFSRFKSKDSSAKKTPATLTNGNALAKPAWSDAWIRTRVDPEEVAELLRECTSELKSRALDIPFMLLPFRPSTETSAARIVVRNYFSPAPGRDPLRGRALVNELKMTDAMVLASVIKWCWSRLPGGVVTWETYEMFKIGERDSNYAHDAFSTFVPISVESDARVQIIRDFFDLLAAIAAHGKSNGLSGHKLSRYAGWWAFEHYDTGKGFEAGYSSWSRAADATAHLFFAYLRSMSPESSRGTSGILGLPISLQQLLDAAEYPPSDSLMSNETTRVVMIVDVVSPTPYALLRRAKNFEYRDDDRALQQFSSYEDPVQALTNECQRVLRAISSVNQSSMMTSSKVSTGMLDPSWSRFEDMGFGSTIEESEAEDEHHSHQHSRLATQGLKGSPRSPNVEFGNRPTTPSWADFLSSGFVDENGNKAPAPVLLPPDKILPPISSTMRGQSSQSHRRNLDTNSGLEPGELASINKVEVDDAFWWVWISSLAGEEPTSRKAVFGRCALIETILPDGKWMVMEEQVRGAAPEPAAGAYIAEKKGFLGFTTKRGRLTRRRSAVKKSPMSPDPYNKNNFDGLGRTTLAPDQQAKIQHAAAELSRKNLEQQPVANGMRRGRTDENASIKTSSVFTLQPLIRAEASPAMQWASRYDKTEMRAKYLGDTFAGKGSTDLLTLPSEGLGIGNGSISTQSSSPAKERDLPPPPKEEPVYQAPPALFRPPPPEPVARPVTPPRPSVVERAPLPMEPMETVEPKAAEEAALVALPNGSTAHIVTEPEPEPVVHETVAGKEYTPHSPETPKVVSPPSPTTKRLRKKSNAPPPLVHKPPPPVQKSSGIRRLFGTKRSRSRDSAQREHERQPEPASPVETNPAILAARRALEGKSPPPGAASTSPLPSPGRFNKMRNVQSPSVAIQTIAQQPAPPRPRTPPEETAVMPEPVQAPPPVPERHHQGPPRTRRDEEYDQLSRVDTNEREHADKEFSTFDQGPLQDQPAFVPQPSPDRSGFFTPDEQPQPVFPKQQSVYSAVTVATARTDDEAGPMSDLTQQISPGDRWAQIRKNAAERAAERAARESSDDQAARSRTDTKTDDGETSGEETIESRVARIKARVAELTGNMENARR